MPLAHAPDAAQVAAAVGITADTGTDYRFTDGYAVTYTGTPAHLALSALARRDLTTGIHPDQPTVAVGIRDTARLLIDWFTSKHTDPQHEAEFAALPAMRVCELVVYLCLHGNAAKLRQVGPTSLRYYTDHLLHDPVPSTEHPLPTLIDGYYQALQAPGDRPGTRLQVTAIAPDDTDEITVPMHIHASEDVHWRFTAAIPVPVDRLNELLLDPDYLTGDYLSDNRELIDEYLVCAAGDTDEGLQITGRLASPAAVELDAPSAAPVRVKLFFVGPDRDTALVTTPFSSRELAEQAAGVEDRIFGIGIDVDTDAVYALPPVPRSRRLNFC
ncbi:MULTISPECIES: hypothetical protein [Actinosynnema]|uniref:hypothetical protein n=1 Tax=Actinosynnema TaxID=40566 RepID=UPI0020A2FD57|nr:hypothetical protein [Actinosynnema pretiosum]MCP2097476.1 hypothetical protein [Actinosynnema pretiosum]